MNPIDILGEFYDPGSPTYRLLLHHGNQVAQKALEAARQVQHLKPDCDFIAEAAMLHDIGIFLTDAPSLGCHGTAPYVCHGYLGRELLEEKGLAKHGLVCERHVGAGITLEDIRRQKLPLPLREMVPVTLEEQIICFADTFFSKSKSAEKSVDQIRKTLVKFGPEKVRRFNEWFHLFNGIPHAA